MTRLLLAALVAVTVVSPSPHRSVSLRVSPAVSRAPATVHAQVSVSLAVDQRVLRVEAIDELGNVTAATERPIDGMDGPVQFWIDWRDVPAGRYQVLARVGTNAQVVATAHKAFEVAEGF